jgi:hypothetical protein
MWPGGFICIRCENAASSANSFAALEKRTRRHSRRRSAPMAARPLANGGQSSGARRGGRA